MAEFATNWNDSVIAEFNKVDANSDGVITADECVAAKKKGITLKRESLAGSARSASATAPASTASAISADASTGSSSPAPAISTPEPSAAVAAAAASASLSDIDDKSKAYYQKVFTKYDANGDGKLDASERASAGKDPSAADKDGDGFVTFEEYAIWSHKK